MLRRATAGVVALVGIAALAWAGDDVKTYDIDCRERWTPGQVATVTEHEAEDKEASEGEGPPEKRRQAIDATYVVRCDAADADGNPITRTVFMKSWKQTTDAATDESISGALVTVSGKTWKLADGRTPSVLAKRWLDAEVIGSHKSGALKLVPAKMSVGQTWKPDGKAVLDVVFKGEKEMPFDPGALTAEITLAAVEGTPPNARGRLDVKIHAPITSLPRLPEGGTIGAGCGMESAWDRTGPLTTSTMFATEHCRMDFTVLVTVPKDPSKSAAMSSRTTWSRTTVPGGEIPAQPPPPAPRPASPRGGAPPDPPAPGGK